MDSFVNSYLADLGEVSAAIRLFTDSFNRETASVEHGTDAFKRLGKSKGAFTPQQLAIISEVSEHQRAENITRREINLRVERATQHLMQMLETMSGADAEAVASLSDVMLRSLLKQTKAAINSARKFRAALEHSWDTRAAQTDAMFPDDYRETAEESADIIEQAIPNVDRLLLFYRSFARALLKVS